MISEQLVSIWTYKCIIKSYGHLKYFSIKSGVIWQIGIKHALRKTDMNMNMWFMYECLLRLLVSAEVNSSSHKYSNEMTCCLKARRQMVLAWLVRPVTTTTDDEASWMLQHLRQKHALYRSTICLNMLAVVEFKIN